MRHVKRYRDQLGNERLYFRKTGHPRNGEALKAPWPDVDGRLPLEAEVAADPGNPRSSSRTPATLPAQRGPTNCPRISDRFSERRQNASTRYILKEFDVDLGGLRSPPSPPRSSCPCVTLRRGAATERPTSGCSSSRRRASSRN